MWFYRNLLLFPKGISQLAKTVLSIPTHLRNFFSAGAFAGANGILFEGITNPNLLRKAFAEGIDTSGTLKTWTKLCRGTSSLQRIIRTWCCKLTSANRRSCNLLKDATGNPGVISTDAILNQFMTKLKKLGSFFQGKYVAEDDTWKITNYVVELDRLKQAALKQGVELKMIGVVKRIKTRSS